MDSIFVNSKNVFLDTVNAKDYIQLNRVSTIYQSLKDSIEKPLKMILLFGKPGTGKSIFLTKLHNDLCQENNIYLYQTPILDENEFYKTLAQDIFNIKYNDTLNFTQFMKIVKDREIEQIPIVLLDEAQLYSETLMEKIRLLSDTRSIKFVITLHKTEKEDLIAKEHFQTRIWETFELENASTTELKIYIQKKLMKANCFDTANMFNTKTVNKIYKLTNGNYRDTNKLLYTLFDIYDTYEQNSRIYPINTTHIPNKFVEMAAIHTGLINA
ncbi:ATP-binding protein [Sulfurimonas autotrophica]|uniref:AAA ATPase n=1 Tax=Sulfurimonas autotrophica (strain ATCC BAA-671 / DSM 16294 / JCM 11897 / OK10) TaxID=563040 RepID=E0URA5_SULAO|nr:ATP-binding protein [Sulfurimonas autotrophica]ADN08915.1 AAA ATPase [Sulfurimonas autotrophica DSM 16294]